MAETSLGTCDYCKANVHEYQAYSLKKIGHTKYFSHYVCYLKERRIQVLLQSSALNSLKKYLTERFPDPKGWSLEVLKALN